MSISDHLSRQPFIDLLKSVITNQAEKKIGYSIAIDGAWGSGKTWVLNELESQFASKGYSSYLIFHYNTWENDFYEEPLVAILSIMIEALKVQKKELNEKGPVGKIITSSISALTKVAGSVIEKKYNINLNDIIDETKKAGCAIADVKLTKADFNKLLPLENALSQIKKVLQKLSKERHIIFVIDELDRCLPEYAIRVLERLHHICQESQIVSILAIDKKHLADSIAKVYGKNYDYLAGGKSKELLNFTNLYLQKFIDISIPLSNGFLANAIEGLNGLEGNFKPYSYSNAVGQKIIDIDITYLKNFVDKIMMGIDKRTQEKIISLTALCHELTVASGATLEEYGYQILICEIIHCIYNYVYHKNDLIHHKSNSAEEIRLSFRYSNPASQDNYLNTQFEHNLSEAFKVFPEVDYLGRKKDLAEFSIINADNYIVRRYIDFKKYPVDPIQVMFVKEIENEKVFLTKFLEILEKVNQ